MIARVVGHPDVVDTNIQLEFTGTAILGTDYTVTSTLIHNPSWTISASVIITGIDDSIIEFRESIIIDIVSIDGGELNGFQQATVFLTDNDN
ncbi:MAG: hypothetical protein R3C11_07240 [Planctomycetaceae bacterium]